MLEMNRIFFGLKLEDEINTKLAEYCENCKKRLKNQTIKWIIPSKFHITLHFLGNASQEQIMSLRQAVKPIAERFPEFQTTLAYIDLFPPKHSHIIAAYFKLSNELAELHYNLKQIISHLDMKVEERPYLPHLSLARFESKKTLNWQRENLNITAKFHGLVLFRSINGVYQELDQWNFLKLELDNPISHS